MAARLPDLVVIGAPKAGTTTLARWLGAHPQVAFSANKELEFFDQHWDRGLDWYRDQLPAEPGDRVVAEATPMYLSDPAVPARVAATLPEARFVALLREPVARAWSNYWFFCQLGVEKRTWDRAISSELAGRVGPGYLLRGRYADQLARWDDAVGPDRLHVLLLDDLIADPAASYASVCRFAGLPVVPPPTGGAVNPTSRPRSRQLQNALRSSTAGPLRRRLYTWNSRGGAVPGLESADRDRLRLLFTEDNERLAARLGRELPASWGTAATVPC